jgi:cytochrome c-type biogenesis protein CcmH
MNPDLLSELGAAWVAAFDLDIWGLPLAVTGIGLVIGAVGLFATRDAREAAGAADDARRLDLARRRDEVVEAVRALDVERDKLDPQDYAARRRALLAHGAEALRELDAAASPTPVESPMSDAPPPTLEQALEAERARLGDEKVAAIRRIVAEPDRGGWRIGPKWEGAAWALGAVAVIAGIYLALTVNEGRVEPVASAPPPPADQPPRTPEEAAALARLEAAPNDVEALNELTDWSIRRQQWGEAARYSQRALEAAPTDVVARTWAGVLAFRAGDEATSLRLLDAVLAERPDFPLALQWRGFLALQTGDNEAAIRYLEAAIPVTDDPDMKVALRQLIARARAAAAPAAPELSGTIELDAGVDPAAWGEGATLFVSVRAAGGPPMPLRAKKLPAGPFPLSFALTPADSPMGGGPLPAEIEVTVKVDLDGNPMGDDPGAPKVTVPVRTGPDAPADPLRVVLAAGG